MNIPDFHFSSEIWLYPGKAAWHFITVPSETASSIDFYCAHLKRGWGSLPVHATIGSTTWETSIFPNKKAHSYLLPLKSEVRTKERLSAGDTVRVTLIIRE